jgi:hypothetical protein
MSGAEEHAFEMEMKEYATAQMCFHVINRKRGIRGRMQEIKAIEIFIQFYFHLSVILFLN